MTAYPIEIPMWFRLRHFLIFFVANFFNFEWQAFAMKEFGSAFTGPMQAVFLSLGQVAAFAYFLVPKGKTLPTQQLLSVSMLVIGAVSSIQRAMWDGPSNSNVLLMLISFAMMGAFAMIAMANETHIVHQRGLDLFRVRRFGSLGFLVAAIVSEMTQGSGGLFGTSVALLLLITIQWTPNRTCLSAQPTPEYSSPSLNFGQIIAIAFILSIASKGYDIAGVLELRQKSNFGLYWLGLMIFCEACLLGVPRNLSAKLVVVLAPLCWALAYALLLFPSSNLSIALAMAFVGYNCAWQTTLAHQMTCLQGATEKSQVALNGTILSAGFIATIYAAVAAETLAGLLWVFLVYSALAIPLVLLTHRLWQSKESDPEESHPKDEPEMRRFTKPIDPLQAENLNPMT